MIFCFVFIGSLHPESIDSLKNIKDGSISDVICPWNPVGSIKMEIEPKFDQVVQLKKIAF